MAFGLRPVRYKDGSPYNGAANTYYVPASDATALFAGDPVIIAGDGDANGVASITRASAGGRISGVVVGFTHNPNANSDTAMRIGYRAASTEDYVLVADDTDLLFEVNEDADTTPLAVADIGNNVDVAVGAGSTFTKRSGFSLDSDSKTALTAQLRLHGLSQIPDNTPGTTESVWLVSIVESTESPADGSAGV